MAKPGCRPGSLRVFLFNLFIDPIPHFGFYLHAGAPDTPV
jgi:hypothetical protein